ncbi:MAG: hypothetical protein WCV50_02735 [Patescibacteria group bacterium]|jgi:hypothetical protein
MNTEKWQEIVGQIKDSFEVMEDGKRDLEEDPGYVNFIIFKGPLGKMKLELTTRPLVLDKKGIGSRRIGSQSKVEYIYSESETTQTFKAYKWNESAEEWTEMEGGERGSFKL